jgi:hypothetical protein
MLRRTTPPVVPPERVDATYLLPIRSEQAHRPELTDYLQFVARHLDVVVVDGSPDEVFDAVHPTWSEFAVHIRPDPALQCRNGKVHGVLTGTRLVTTPITVIADDDVRYDRASLQAVVAAADGCDLVVPQNYFEPAPWHARWDSARSLLNRSVGTDFPGTLVVRTALLEGGYDGDVLFENLQLMRTVEARGGRCCQRPDIYVRRLPPATRHFLGQRVRQAYDEFARPARLVLESAALPAVVGLTARRDWRRLLAGAIATVALAEVGRRRHGGRDHFGWSTSWWAPVWVLERSVCTWVAWYHRSRGGIRYAGARLATAATHPAPDVRPASASRSDGPGAGVSCALTP